VCAFLQAALTGLAVLIVYALYFGGTDPEPVSLAVTLHRVLVLGLPIVGIVLLVGGGVLLLAGRSRWPLIVGCAVELVVCGYYTVLFTDHGVGEISIAFVLIVWSCFAPMPAISLIAALRSSTTRYLNARAAPPEPA
jgi:hypothetical protein